MTCVHGPSLVVVVSPFPPLGVGLGKNHARPPVSCQGRAYNAATGSKQGASYEQTRTPRFGCRGGGVPGGRRDHAPAVPHPAPWPFRRQRRRSREEQGFLLPVARLS